MSSETSNRSTADDETNDVVDLDAASDAVEADESYVHEPATDEASTEPYTGKAEGEGFGNAGWVLVAAVVVCFLVIPGIIYLNPTAPAQLGWTFFATFLVLPLIPAVILGLIAVWSMQAAA